LFAGDSGDRLYVEVSGKGKPDAKLVLQIYEVEH
jgi:hypothetical protein